MNVKLGRIGEGWGEGLSFLSLGVGYAFLYKLSNIVKNAVISMLMMMKDVRTGIILIKIIKNGLGCI